MSVNTRSLVLTVVFLAVVFGLCAMAFHYPHPTSKAINLVKNHTTDIEDVKNYVEVNGNFLTTGDLIQQDINTLFGIGLQARAEWDAADDGGGWYKVTVREQIKEFGEWVDFQIMQWRVNPDTKEIVALDNTARAYL